MSKDVRLADADANDRIWEEDTTQVTRILIADDHDVICSGLRSILKAHPNWKVVAKASDGKDAILKAIEAKPDVAVLDYSLPLVNGVEATRQSMLGCRELKFSSSRCMTMTH